MINNNVNNGKNNPFRSNNYLIWLLVYMSIILSISLIVLYPVSLGVSVLVLVLLNVFRTDLALKRQDMNGIKGLYKSMSSGADRSSNIASNGFEYPMVEFYYIS